METEGSKSGAVVEFAESAVVQSLDERVACKRKKSAEENKTVFLSNKKKRGGYLENEEETQNYKRDNEERHGRGASQTEKQSVLENQIKEHCQRVKDALSVQRKSSQTDVREVEVADRSSFDVKKEQNSKLMERELTGAGTSCSLSDLHVQSDHCPSQRSLQQELKENHCRVKDTVPKQRRRVEAKVQEVDLTHSNSVEVNKKTRSKWKERNSVSDQEFFSEGIYGLMKRKKHYKKVRDGEPAERSLQTAFQEIKWVVRSSFDIKKEQNSKLMERELTGAGTSCSLSDLHVQSDQSPSQRSLQQELKENHRRVKDTLPKQRRVEANVQEVDLTHSNSVEVKKKTRSKSKERNSASDPEFFSEGIYGLMKRKKHYKKVRDGEPSERRSLQTAVQEIERAVRSSSDLKKQLSSNLMERKLTSRPESSLSLRDPQVQPDHYFLYKSLLKKSIENDRRMRNVKPVQRSLQTNVQEIDLTERSSDDVKKEKRSKSKQRKSVSDQEFFSPESIQCLKNYIRNDWEKLYRRVMDGMPEERGNLQTDGQRVEAAKERSFDVNKEQSSKLRQRKLMSCPGSSSSLSDLHMQSDHHPSRRSSKTELNENHHRVKDTMPKQRRSLETNIQEVDLTRSNSVEVMKKTRSKSETRNSGSDPGFVSDEWFRCFKKSAPK